MVRDLSRSLAILIGNSRYRRDSGIPDLPAASMSVAAVAKLLTSDLCGWPADRVQQLLDVPAPHELARRITQAVKDVQGILLLYYVGHGMRTPKGQLALALGDSDGDPSLLPYTAILYENVADILRGCPATTKLVILDCCHAELGNKSNYVFQSATIAEAYPVDGMYFIGASKTHEKAKTPKDGTLTYFTGSLIDTIEGGIPRRPEFLGLGDIFLALRSRMLSQGLPEPVDSGIRDARQFPFARNAAPAEVVVDYEAEYNRLLREPALASRAQHLRILNNALRTAGLMTELGARALALADIATALAVTYPDRSSQVSTDAEHAALSMTETGAQRRALTDVGKAAVVGYFLVNIPRLISAADQAFQVITDFRTRSWVLAVVVAAVAVTDLDRAEVLAQSITDERPKIAALISLIKATTDPDRAGRLSADAELIALSVTDKDPKASSLARIAKAAGSDVGRAARVTYHATWKAQALADIAAALAAVEPDRAARLCADAGRAAESITDKDSKISAQCAVAAALTAVAAALAATDPDRAVRLCADAERVALSIVDMSAKAATLAAVAEGLAATDPDRAVRLCADAERSAEAVVITRLSPRWVAIPKAEALSAVVAALIAAISAATAAADPVRAAQISADAERVAQSITIKSSRVRALAAIADAVTGIDPDHAARLCADAELVAQSITTKGSRVRALAAIAEAVSACDPRFAVRLCADGERIAQSIGGGTFRSRAQAAIAAAQARFDPDRAESMALFITDKSLKVAALVRVAKALQTRLQEP